MFRPFLCILLIAYPLLSKESSKLLYNFKGIEHKQRFTVYYDQQLSKWKLPFEKRAVSTSFGNTNVIVCGKNGARPLVLLHGFNGTATMWRDVAAALETEFKVYAVDIMGDINMSEPNTIIKKSADFALWLKETVTGCGVENACFIGESYGGWHIMNAAYRYPELFQRSIVINPMPGLTDFTLKGNLAFMWLALFHDKNNVRNFLNKMVITPTAIDTDFENLFYSAFQEGTMAIPSDGYVLKKEDFQKISFPMYFILGDRDFFAKPKNRLKRQHELHKNSEMIVIKEAGHDIVLERPDIIVKYALEKFR